MLFGDNLPQHIVLSGGTVSLPCMFKYKPCASLLSLHLSAIIVLTVLAIIIVITEHFIETCVRAQNALHWLFSALSTPSEQMGGKQHQR